MGFGTIRYPWSLQCLDSHRSVSRAGGPWAVIEGIEPVFVAVGSSLVVLFFVIGFCSESIDVNDEMRFESILRMLIRLGLAEWFVANNVTIMKAFFTSMH